MCSYLLGVMDGMTYESYELALDPGDALLLATDGLWGAKDPSGASYDAGRLGDLMGLHRGASAETLVGAIQNDLLSFIGETPLADDVTLLCLRNSNGSVSD